MTRYTVDAVAMARYLVDRLPPTADDVFRRAENGIDVLEAPPVTVSETIWTAVNNAAIGGIEVDTTPNRVLGGLVTDGPIQIAPTDKQDLAVFGSLIDHHTLHDALIIANHRVRETEAIVTSDSEFAAEKTVWQ